MADLTIADHRATFIVHPLEGSSRFGLLGLLAELKGITKHIEPFDDSVMDERERFRDKHHSPGFYPPGVLEEADRLMLEAFEAERNKQHDDRDLANAMFGERVVDAMFGDGPVRVTMSNGSESAATAKHVSPETKVQDA